MNKKILILIFFLNLLILTNIVYAEIYEEIYDSSIISYDESTIKINVVGTSIKVTENQESIVINLGEFL